MQHDSVLTLDRPTTSPDFEQELVAAWLDRHDDTQLAATLGVRPGDAGDVRDWLERPRRPRGPGRATERREAIAESSGHFRNRTRQPRGGAR